MEQLYLLQLWVCTWYSSLILYQVHLRPVVDLCCTQVWRHFEAGLRFEWFTAGTGGCQSQLQLDLEPFPSNWSKQAHHHHIREAAWTLVMVESPAFGKEGLEDLSRLDR